MKKSPLYALILAGGASSRLFPFNKILSDLSDSGNTLIQEALGRATSVAAKKNVYILTVQELVGPMTRQLHLSKEHFFVDPVRRGTWPALMWAMAHLRRENPEAVLAILTGDHVIPKLSAFKRAALHACDLAVQKPAVVMLGVSPTNDALSWTGFGVFRVKGETVADFAEKPALPQARRMIRQGGWQWNSGMFFFRISTAEQALARYQPVMFAQYEKLCRAVAGGKKREAQAIYAEFPARIPHPLDSKRLVDNTIDFAIMAPLVESSRLEAPGSSAFRADSLEPRAEAVTGGLPLWTDLGQWEALSAVVKPTKRRNIEIGRVRSDSGTFRCILAADRSFELVVHGLSDAVVAVSKRGILVLKRPDLPAIKEHVAKALPKKFLVVNGFPGVQIERHGRRVVVSGAAVIR